MRLKRICAALVASFAIAAVAQDMSEADMAASAAARAARRDGRYLRAVDVLRPLAFDASGKPKANFIYDQWAESLGLITNEPGPRVFEPGDAPPPADADTLAALATAKPQDAIATIVARARATRLVILNEDHASPRDRAFGLQVAQALRPLGYDVLGVETLSNVGDEAKAAQMMATLQSEGYPHPTTGYYSQDPVFADFLRQSLALGYRPVAYEITDDDRSGDTNARIARREQSRADYVVARALKAYPKSKVLLYVGFSHATEQPERIEGGERRWLATRLKAMTGIDPLTIDQTTLNEYGSRLTALHASVAARIGHKPAIFFSSVNSPLVVGHYKGLVDLQVAHPRTARIGGRPDWLASMQRKPTPIPANLLPEHGRRLVQAFVATEKNAIPIDQVVVTAGEALPMLMLPTSPVRYAIEDPAN